MDFVFEHFIAIAITLGMGSSLLWAITAGRQSLTLLAGLRARFGGEIVRRWIQPSELHLASDDRLLIFSSFVGSGGGGQHGSSPPSVYTRVFFQRWPTRVPEFALRRRRPSLLARLVGWGGGLEVATGDAAFDQDFVVSGDVAEVVPFLLAASETLRELCALAGDDDVRLQLRREVPPQDNTWKRGDPIIRTVSETEIDALRVACLTLSVDGVLLRPASESARILEAAARLATGLEALRTVAV